MKKINLTLLFIIVLFFSHKNCLAQDVYERDVIEANIDKENSENIRKFKDAKEPTPLKVTYPNYTDSFTESKQTDSKNPKKEEKTISDIIEQGIKDGNQNQSNQIFPPTVSVRPDKDGNYAEKKFEQGALGYDLTKSIEGNEEIYRRSGYTISYSIKDTTIYFIIVGLLFLSGIIIFYINKRKKYLQKFVTEN